MENQFRLSNKPRKLRQIQSIQGVILAEFIMVIPVIALLITIPPYLFSIFEQKQAVLIANYDNSSSLQAGEAKEDDILSFVKASDSMMALGDDYKPTISTHVETLNRGESFGELRSRFLSTFETENTPLNDTFAIRNEMLKLYQTLFIQPERYVLFDDWVSPLSAQTDLSVPFITEDLGNMMKDTSDPSDGLVLPPTISMSSLAFQETNAGYHSEHYTYAGLLGLGLGFFGNPTWGSTAGGGCPPGGPVGGFNTKCSWTVQCPYNFRANNSCEMWSIYGGILTSVAMVGGIANLLADIFGEGEAQDAAKEAIKKLADQLAKEVADAIEQQAEDYVKGKVNDFKEKIENDVKKEVDEKLQELTKDIMNKIPGINNIVPQTPNPS